jgi:hypothetical protein
MRNRDTLAQARSLWENREVPPALGSQGKHINQSARVP